MKREWPETATPQQRQATAEFVQQLHSKYPGRILSMVLFGSVARGDFTADSDIDVLVVADYADADFKWDVWGIGARISLEHDVILNVHVYSKRRWEEARAGGRTLWRNVEQDGIELPAEAVPA